MTTDVSGAIEAWIYDQEGQLQPFRMKDTPFNRAFAEWLRVHDRYTPRHNEQGETP